MQRIVTKGAQTLSGAWKSLLPSSVSVVSGPIRRDAPSLTALERSTAGCVNRDRMLELTTGRDYAKRALSELGYDNVQLPIGTDRSPVWPSDVIGSITHAKSSTKSHCAAAVGRLTDLNSIGIDVEPDTLLLPDVWTIILTAHELTQISALAATDRNAEVLRRWCVKEAMAKASRSNLDPSQIETEKVHSSAWDFIGTTDRFRWVARTAQAEGFVLAAVTIPQN
jgi:4'-phosphopantetheinyl transferase EntD